MRGRAFVIDLGRFKGNYVKLILCISLSSNLGWKEVLGSDVW